jgi:hypothetical protein
MSRFLRVVRQRRGVDNRLAVLGRFVVRQTHKRVVGGPLIVRWRQLTVAPHSPSAAAALLLRTAGLVGVRLSRTLCARATR